MGLLARLTWKPKKKTPRAQHEQAIAKTSHHGVQVMANSVECCEAVRAIAGKLFLANDVPLLPLRECTSSDCQCTYKHYDDRRTDARRDWDIGLGFTNHFITEEKRDDRAPGRRNDD